MTNGMAKRVLVTSAGSNVAIGIAKSLAGRDDIVLIGSDSENLDFCAGMHWFSSVNPLPRADSHGYIDSLVELCVVNKIDLVIPVHDMEIEVIAHNVTSIPSIVAVSSAESVSLANDKLKCNQFFASSIHVPDVGDEKLEKGDEVIVKPRRGVSSRGHFIGSWPLDEEFSLQDFIVQKRVSGVEYTVDVYRSFLGDVVKAGVRERIATKDGQSVKGVIRAIPELEELSIRVAMQLDLRGAINVQWIYDGKKFWFIEVNPRFAGAGILTYANGYNMPDWTIQELLFSVPIGTETGDLKIGTHMSRYWEEHFVET